jgi:predicted membrane-bound mannosyltransferase
VLGTLVVWLAALFARRTSRSRAAALAAAALMAVAAYPVEHAHYLESDVAMLASVALALYLLVRAIEKKTLGSLAAAAAFAVGFAAGTKFPMAILLAPLLASIRLRQPAASGRARARRLAGKIALALALALAGFVVASPDALHVASFVHGLRHGESSVYAETAGLLGAAAKEPHAREWMNAANMAHFARSLGAAWLLVAALGLPCCFLRRFRAFWPATLLFPALHLWFIVSHAPWSRSQEFMALIPNFCLWAALPAAVLWNVRRRPALGKTAALALVAVALLPAARNGVAMSSQFAWKTPAPRQPPAENLLPASRVLGTELYTAPAEIGVACHTVGIGKYESAGADFIRTNEIDYVC